MSDLGRRTRALLGVACALALAQSPARAAGPHCAEWHRLGVEQKDARLREEIGAVVRSPEKRQIHIDRGVLERCLEAEGASIRDAFDDACAEGIGTDLDALDRIFRDFVATCAG
jgi:hypothetical protein